MDNSEKLKALDAAISKIEKDFGKGAIMKLGDKSKNMDVETVPTGSLSLDLALGLGGLPKGRVVEIYGLRSLEFSVCSTSPKSEMRSWMGR